MWFELFLVMLASTAHAQCEYTIYVDGKNGSNIPSCLNAGSLENACKTLAYASKGTEQDSTEIVLLSGMHALADIVNITAHSQIAISGVGSDRSVVRCSQDGLEGAALNFTLVTNLTIANLTFENCGGMFVSSSRNYSSNSTLKFRSAVYILNSTNVTVQSCQFMDGSGIGLSLFDTNGTVSILHSNFSGNKVPISEDAKVAGGGGIFIEHTYCTPGLLSCDFEHNPYSRASKYTIINSHFHDNVASRPKHWNSAQPFIVDEKSRVIRLGKGGGLSIALKGKSALNQFFISECSFINNTAGYGGGLDIAIQDSSTNNFLQIEHCIFHDNSADTDGGGARVSFEFYECDCVADNDIQFVDTHFIHNTAKWGGGVEFFSGRARNANFVNNNITFEHCFWIENSASMASAVDLSPDAWIALSDGSLPTPVFQNCSFMRNQVHSLGNVVIDSGTVFVNTFTVNFTLSVTFEENVGTAIYVQAGCVNILDGTHATFSSNQGGRGSAVALVGMSFLQVFESSVLCFQNNYASDVGGAIYAFSHDETDFVYSRSCFIRSPNSPLITENATFFFINNTAAQYGNSIYATSLLPCARAGMKNGSETINVSLSDVFRGPNFHYINSSETYNIATDPATIEYSTQNLYTSPGELYDLNVTAYDDLNNSVKTVYTASISVVSGSAKVDNSFLYISNGKIKILGNIDSTFQLNLQTTGSRQIRATLNATLVKCPPGYVYPKDRKQCECICSAVTVNQQYTGISKCDSQEFVGILNKGFWAGCDDHNGTLLTAECPLGYCYEVNTNTYAFVLKKTCKDLDEAICGPRNRTGLLCGKCKENLTVFYHSERYRCAECPYSDLGWLFYLLSEILPLTIFFVVIIVFNISLTSGAANGFIFFAQVLDFFDVNSLGSFTLPPGVAVLTHIYRFIFGWLNLDFFRLDALSFCLWKGATILDVLVFKYITTAYAALLLLLLVGGFNCFRCYPRPSCFGVPVRKSVIHGITAFFIISYAQCAKVSFQILTRIQLKGEGPVSHTDVVFLSGTTKFLHDDHLPYALPAMFVLLTICTVPPVVLIAYPAVNRIWDFFRCDQRLLLANRAPHYIMTCCRIEKLKPLIDSFQGCFKDSFRFFAGLFFLYRLAISAAFAFSTSAVQLYLLLEVIVIVLLTFHACAQPYEKRFYNVVDMLIFGDLAIINSISLYDFFWSQYSSSTYKSSLVVASSIQVALIYLPIVYMAVFITLKVAAMSRRMRPRLWNINRYIPLFEENAEYIPLQNAGHEPFDANHLPARMFDEERIPLPRQRHRNNYGTNQRVTL